ncbi:hypothetical protein EMIHUDRAFT_202809 [Emiliania huxleyi CCMP1516]|uniref:GT23 domain-containing protein n=2 Tax=Emiliania huxleyi TaxID=2903 RepID=A0A0D3K8U8_EMIH1|nr:hypothetical protein EMIHUDRAFT_202809 [Emiliania huxleyi CCMP1516]EOD32183.1 hypothetical protein EMIHUDRAFT_202809 [Emiliania huxleyi CCMP1516]|eukprot:XP_005784612.1 hypothetical protein EMIHUDRAFT_202809 [Emiliania huxleyi CCMP1516]
MHTVARRRHRHLHEEPMVPCIFPSSSLNTTLLTHNAVTFLPRPGSSEAPQADDPVASAVAALDASIAAWLRPQQTACKERGFRFVVREGGFGSTLNSLVKELLWALLHGRPPLGEALSERSGSRRAQHRLRLAEPAPLELFRNATTCANASLECFLQPLTNCSAESRTSQRGMAHGGRWLEVVSHEEVLAMAPPGTEPLRADIAAAGRFALVSLLLASLLRPSGSVAARLRAVRSSLGWPEAEPRAARGGRGAPPPLLIGVHLRAGDACDAEALARHNRTCEPLSAFAAAVQAVVSAYGGKRRVRRKWQTLRRRGGGAGVRQIEQLISGGSVDGHEDATSVMVDLLLLASCDVLIGKFSSNIDRLAYSLMAVRRGREHRREQAEGVAAEAEAASQRASPPLCLPPYVSLDHPWCADWGVRLPIRTLSPLPYAAALPTVPTLREEEGSPPRVVGGFEC